MILANLLLCVCCIAIVSSLGDDELPSNSSVCEERSPADGILIDLSYMGLVNIRKNVVSSPEVTGLNLAGNEIKTIEPGAFDGLLELKYLDLSMNPVKFSDFISTHFPKLQTLIVDGPFKYQRYYQFDDSYDVPSNVTKVLPNLEKLSLCKHTQSFALIWLRHLIAPKLTHLYLSKNDLAEDFIIPDIYVSSIRHINLDNNRFDEFLYTFSNLRSLSMNHNQISNLCNKNCNTSCEYKHMSLRGMPQLEELSLMNNGIIGIDKNAFEYSGNLRILNLGNNSLQYFSNHTFDNMRNLTVLKLNNNQLMEVLDICALINLVELQLDGNKINYVDEMSFCDLPNLAVINLSHNGLYLVSANTFVGLPSLKELDLSWNNLKSLPDNWMGLESNLHTLRLHGNVFNDFANMSLGHLKELQLLSIGHNPIKTITVQSLLTFPMNMNIDVL